MRVFPPSQMYLADEKDVHMALKAAGGSGETNPRVQGAIGKARDGGVPKSAIEAALARVGFA